MANLSKQHIFRKNEQAINKLFYDFLAISQSRQTSAQATITYAIIVLLVFLGGKHVWDKTRAVRCILPNTYLIWEASRPITNCDMCRNVTNVLDLPNVTKEEFQMWAYTSRPVVVRKAAQNWPASRIFSFYFLKELLSSVEGSYRAVEDDCQLLTFKSDFVGLQQVFEMDNDRVLGLPGSKPWYVGWSFCQPELVKRMRQYYPRPHFLPEDAEHSHIDYVFMGYNQGAIMHLDYISRLLWQAQLIGSKTWRLVPPPECQNICSEMSVQVNQGDIILLDTRQWYHDTKVPSGQFSLTVSSEYG